MSIQSEIQQTMSSFKEQVSSGNVGKETKTSDEQIQHEEQSQEVTLTDSNQDDGQIENQEGSATESQEPAVKAKSQKLYKYKADGQEYEDSEEEILRLASMGKHGERKNTELNKLINENKIREREWNSFLRDPKAVARYVAQHLDKNEIKNYFADNQSQKEEMKEIIKIDDEYDTENEKVLKGHLNKVLNEVRGLKEQIENQNDKSSANDLRNDFESKRQTYGIPSNAVYSVLGLLRMGEAKMPGYNMDNAMYDYMMGLPKPEEFISGATPSQEIIDAIKGNNDLYNALYDEIVTEYNVNESKRKETTPPVPKSTSKAPTQSKEDKPQRFRDLDKMIKNSMSSFKKQFLS